MKENRPTLVFVFVMLMGLLWAFVADFGIPPQRLVFYGVILLVEMWAISNKRRGDTISEAFWELSSRPLVPWTCGMLTMYFTMHGTLLHAEIAALIGLQSHFFWQADRVYKEVAAAAVDAKVEAVAATAAVATVAAIDAVTAPGGKS